MKPKNEVDISQVEGNASPEIKRAFLSTVQYLRTPRQSSSQSTGELFRSFETELLSRLRLVDVSILPKAEEPEKLEGRVVFEVIADEEMLSDYGTMHGGCTAMLIDECSSMSIYVLGLATSGYGTLGVSLSLNTTYHSPALLGDKLRIVSTTLTLGSRALSARCEVWNVTRHRLVASAVHIKMDASEPKPSVKL